MAAALAQAFGSLKAATAQSIAYPLAGQGNKANADPMVDAKGGDIVVPAIYSHRRRLSTSIPATVYQPPATRLAEMTHNAGGHDSIRANIKWSGSRMATPLGLQALSRFRSGSTSSVASSDGDEIGSNDTPGKGTPSIRVKGTVDYNKPEYMFSCV